VTVALAAEVVAWEEADQRKLFRAVWDEAKTTGKGVLV